ncbi:MAG: hypothetical protein AAF035_02870 [Pseudomonadota bacterium]
MIESVRVLGPHTHVRQLLDVSDLIFVPDDVSPVVLRARFDTCFGQSIKNAETQKEFVAALSKAKRAVAVWYAHAMLGEDALFDPNGLDDEVRVHDLVESNRRLGGVWAAFADWSLQKACRFAVSQHALSRYFPKDEHDPLDGYFLLGLGKLGGRDLNYSSDVDVIAFFDAEQFRVLPGQGKTDIAARIAKSVTQLLSGQFGERIWRVDWRLRPDPSVTGLAMATDAGLDFHFFHAAPWRRLAMMKARPVAGDLAAGQAFLKELTPFVWRKTLDYRALDDIAGIKSRIRDEHPDLAEERTENVPLDRLRGFHLKLGTGGIREIEFIANGLQLVWGGRTPGLQTVNTLEAVEKLVASGRLPAEDGRFLRGAYCLLRGLENRVQMIDDGHVHHVPGMETGEADAFLLFATLSHSDEATLTELVSSMRRRVHSIFTALFDEAAGAAPTPQKTPVGKAGNLALSDLSQTILQQWRELFVVYGVPPHSSSRMAPLYKSLVELLASSDRADESVQAIDSFFRSLPPGGQYMLLLAEHADLASDILEPLTGGGAMAILLRQSPHVVDTLVQRGGVARTTADERQDLGSFVAIQRDYESQLEALRLHVNEMLYLAYLRVWRQRIEPAEARVLLSDLASEALERAVDLVASNYYPAQKDKHPHLSIAGYGKLGMGEMMPLSDLDIVFIAHGKTRDRDADIDGAHRFSNRLKTALSTPMRGGIVYEIDTRLRPSGGAGAPTVRLSTLRTHQMERAKTWEHLALVPARIVYGPEFVCHDFAAVRADVLRRPRDGVQFIRDCHSMLTDLRAHRIRPPQNNRLALKLIPGGLMEAEYLISVLTIQAAPDHPDITDVAYRNLPQRLEALAIAPAGFTDAVGWFQDVHVLERLYGWDNRDLSTLPHRQSPTFRLGEDFERVLKQHRDLITGAVAELIVKPSGLTSAKLKKHPFDPVAWA